MSTGMVFARKRKDISKRCKSARLNGRNWNKECSESELALDAEGGFRSLQTVALVSDTLPLSRHSD